MSKWDCKDGTPDEDHNWQVHRDWYGDPDVINGTADYHFKRCRECGKEAECTSDEVASYYDYDDY